MSKDKELEIQMQFLEEARDYLNTLEAVLLEMDTSKRINLERINAALRAAHSIKGGAGMMGYRTLSDLAHRLEDSFKVLKTRKNSRDVDPHAQNLLLSAVDWLRQIIESLSQGNEIEQQWLDSFCYPVFKELRDHLGEPSPEDAATMLSPEDGQDIIPMLFQTEVEGCLQRLESVLADISQPCLQEEVAIMAAELGGLGEMLQLPAFTSLCESIAHHISTVTRERIPEVAQLALQAWRRSQALVLTNQAEILPTEIYLKDVNIYIPEEVQTTAEAIPTKNTISSSEITTVADKYITHTEDLNKDWEPRENTVRVPIQQLDQIHDLFAELTVQRNGLNFQLQKLRKLVGSLHQRVQTLERENYELRTTYEKIAHPSVNTNPVRSLGEYQLGYIKKFPTLEMDRQDEINRRSHEIIESIVELQEVTTDIQLSVDDTDQISRKLNQTSKQLGRKINHIRMRPFSDLVERFPRALHALNVEYGKNVKLKIEGRDTLIERSILEALNEPIMHLLRNAFDHGIEDPATRRALGKPEQGLIEITASHRSNRIIVTMRDDGRGIS
ncbi:Hpt domain-containing protein [Anabaenopsis tanganyikae CS-531]|nr:Hpt domain-containing protein [Anabaenopsis tanganyikae]MDH6106406.1 Hpt domain-containing protein [Anabaenopsis tanganyikae CS-531]